MSEEKMKKDLEDSDFENKGMNDTKKGIGLSSPTSGSR